MQKKLIALAVAGLASTGAFAQSNVTVYGLLDLGLQHASATGKDSVNKIGSMSSNLFGFKGTEDLGNGLSAGFTLEGGIAADTGAGATVTTTGSKLFSRQSFLSLSSKTAGTVLVGRFNTFGRAASINASATPLSGVDPIGLLAQTAGFSISGNGIDADNTGGRISNGVGYVSPSFNGLTVGYAHSFAENVGPLAPTAATAARNNNPSFTINELWLGYKNGPLNVDYVYNNIGSVGVAAVGTTAATSTTATLLAIGPIQEHFLGAEYDFGVVKLLASYQTRKTEATNTDKVTNIGASIPVSAAGKVGVSYAKLSMGSDLKGTAALGTAGIGFGATAATTLNDASGYAVSYMHALSKRTSAYTTYTRLKNDNNGTINAIGSTTPLAGGSVSVFSLGMQHSF
ncbi:MAG: porin [Rhodocyclaceae bacterium]|nr:MAG: porin [Rhodocyclaceae bacterium]